MFFIWLKALWRVVMAYWNLRHFKWTFRRLHFVPLMPDSNRSYRDAHYSAINERPTLCGTYIDPEKIDGTTQPSIVGCFECAKLIEADPERWLVK